MHFCCVTLFISGIFILTFSHNALCQCVESTPCKCIREDGMGYDLLPLKGKFFTDERHHRIKFKPCENANLTFGISTLSESECNSTSICRLDSNNNSISLGRVEDSEWKLSTDKNEARLIFHHTSPNKSHTYVTKILLRCESCVTSTLQVNSSNQDEYNLIFLSQSNCLIRLKPRGLSTGSVLVIMFCVFSTLYLVGGALVSKIFRGAVGLELIPNYEFWFNLPGLVRDGVTFTLSGCTALSYEPI